jgi:homocitrate synthase NifV
MKIHFCDTTLRDGEQAPGVSFRVNERKKIAKMLDEMGIDLLEIGIPAMSRQEQMELRQILAVPKRAQVCTWNRALTKDIDASIESGATYVHISIPVSTINANSKFLGGIHEAKKRLFDTIEYARKKNLQVSVGFEDASRADPHWMGEIANQLTVWDVSRIRFADTVGILTPATTAHLIRNLRQATTIPIEFHGHNDFGLAVANSLSALENGATWVSTTVMGLGERAGNASMETVALAARHLLDMTVDLDFTSFPTIAGMVSKWSKRKIPVDYPVIGDLVFTHESGIHVDGTIKSPGCYEPYDPLLVGRDRRIVYGRHSGRHGIVSLLETIGESSDSSKVESLLMAVQKMAKTKKTFLSANDVWKLYQNRHQKI